MEETGASVVEAQLRRAVTIDELRRHRQPILALAERHGLANVRVFGSVARGEADADSDLDLLVDPGPQVSLLTLTAFALEVEALLSVFTQVVTPGGLRARAQDRILTEALPV